MRRSRDDGEGHTGEGHRTRGERFTHVRTVASWTWQAPPGRVVPRRAPPNTTGSTAHAVAPAPTTRRAWCPSRTARAAAAARPRADPRDAGPAPPRGLVGPPTRRRHAYGDRSPAAAVRPGRDGGRASGSATSSASSRCGWSSWSRCRSGPGRRSTRSTQSPTGQRPGDQPGTNYLIVGSDKADDLTEAQQKALGTGPRGGTNTDTIIVLHTGSGAGHADVDPPRHPGRGPGPRHADDQRRVRAGQGAPWSPRPSRDSPASTSTTTSSSGSAA